MAEFAEPAKQQLSVDIERDIETSRRLSRYNQQWDIRFRVVGLLLGLAIVVCSGLASTTLVAEPKYWSIASTIFASASTLFSTFAFRDFAFHRRQRIWEKKANVLQSLLDELRYARPDEKIFRKRLDEVRAWNDQSDPDKVR